MTLFGSATSVTIGWTYEIYIEKIMKKCATTKNHTGNKLALVLLICLLIPVCEEHPVVVESVSACEERMSQILQKFSEVVSVGGSVLIVKRSDEIRQIVLSDMVGPPWIVEDPESGDLDAVDPWNTGIRIGVTECAGSHLIVVRSAGPDRKFSAVGASSDDDIMLAIDCPAEMIPQK